MAVFTDVSSFANHVASFGAKIEGAQPAAVKAAAEVAAIAIRQSGSNFHIKGRAGGKFNLGAKVDGPYGYGGNWIAYVKAEPAGFWAMIEHGAKPHWIMPRGVTRGSRQRRGQKGAQAMFGAGYDHPFAQPVWHPGTGGAIGHPWEIGVAKASAASTAAYERAVLAVF